MLISMRCGQDSDCNPASVGGILGCFYGYEALDDKWSSALDWDGATFQYTDYTFNGAIEANLEAAQSVIAVSYTHLDVYKRQHGGHARNLWRG